MFHIQNHKMIGSASHVANGNQYLKGRKMASQLRVNVNTEIIAKNAKTKVTE